MQSSESTTRGFVDVRIERERYYWTTRAWSTTLLPHDPPSSSVATYRLSPAATLAFVRTNASKGVEEAVHSVAAVNSPQEYALDQWLVDVDSALMALGGLGRAHPTDADGWSYVGDFSTAREEDMSGEARRMDFCRIRRLVRVRLIDVNTRDVAAVQEDVAAAQKQNSADSDHGRDDTVETRDTVKLVSTSSVALALVRFRERDPHDDACGLWTLGADVVVVTPCARVSCRVGEHELVVCIPASRVPDIPVLLPRSEIDALDGRVLPPSMGKHKQFLLYTPPTVKPTRTRSSGGDKNHDDATAAAVGDLPVDAPVTATVVPQLVDAETVRVDASVAAAVVPQLVNTETVRVVPAWQWASQPFHWERKRVRAAHESLAAEFAELVADMADENGSLVRDFSDDAPGQHEICEEENEYVNARRAEVCHAAIAEFCGLDQLHSDDVPTIAVAYSGGGTRALLNAAGWTRAAQEMGLLDCVSLASGVSGGSWFLGLWSQFPSASASEFCEHMVERLGHDPFLHSPLTWNRISNRASAAGAFKPGQHVSVADVYGLCLAYTYLSKEQLPGGDERLAVRASTQKELITAHRKPFPIYSLVSPLATRTQSDADVAGLSYRWIEVSPFEVADIDKRRAVPTRLSGCLLDHSGRILSVGPEPCLGEWMGACGSAFCASVDEMDSTVKLPAPIASLLRTVLPDTSGKGRSMVEPTRLWDWCDCGGGGGGGGGCGGGGGGHDDDDGCGGGHGGGGCDDDDADRDVTAADHDTDGGKGGGGSGSCEGDNGSGDGGGGGGGGGGGRGDGDGAGDGDEDEKDDGGGGGSTTTAAGADAGSDDDANGDGGGGNGGDYDGDSDAGKSMQYMSVVDAGVCVNAPLPPFFRSGRHVDLVICVDARPTEVKDVATARNDSKDVLRAFQTFARERGWRVPPMDLSGVGDRPCTVFSPPENDGERAPEEEDGGREQKKCDDVQVEQDVDRDNDSLDSWCVVADMVPRTPSHCPTVAYMGLVPNADHDAALDPNSLLFSFMRFQWTKAHAEQLLGLAQANTLAARDSLRESLRAIIAEKRRSREARARQASEPSSQ